MTIAELIETLQDYAETAPQGEDTEVRLMTQENWPFENKIHGVCLTSELHDEDEDDEEEAGCDEEEQDKDEMLYIVEGRQLGYGCKSAWNVC